MKRLPLILLLNFQLFYCQKSGDIKTCNLSYEAKNDSVNISLNNFQRENIKIPESINYIMFQIPEIERFDNDKNVYTPLKGTHKDINCSGSCNGKLVKLKKNNTYTYKNEIKEILKFNHFKDKGKYRFKIYFFIIEFPEACNELKSDWIYYELK